MKLRNKLLFVIFNCLCLPLNLVVILLLIIAKWVVILLSKITNQDFVCPIPSASCVFLADSIWTHPHSSIVSVLEVEGSVTREGIAATFQKIYDIKDPRGQRGYRELGYYPVRYFGFGFWKQMENFDIIDRIHLFNGIIERKMHEEPLASIAERTLRQPYIHGDPVWDMYLLPNYNGKPNRTLVIFRLHHIMADGMSGIKLLYAGFGHTKLPPTHPKASTAMSQWDDLSRSIFVKVSKFFSTVTLGLVEYFDQILIHRDRHRINFDDKGKLNLTGNWICSFGKEISVSQLKRASKGYECSIVHVFLAGLSRALEKYFVKYYGEDEVPKEPIHFISPVPIPNHPDARLVNHWTLANFESKLDINMSTIDRIELLKLETKKASNSSLPIVTAFMFQIVCAILPTPLVNLMSKTKAAATIVLSNLVGPPVADTFAGGKVVDLFFWMPIVQESCALSGGLATYDGKAHICLTADSGAIPDRSRLDDLNLMAYDEILEICKPFL